MAYEELVVVSFGLALAILSVALFWAHIQRLNAPNKPDPAGTVIDIDLTTAIAQDQASHPGNPAGAWKISSKDILKDNCSRENDTPAVFGCDRRPKSLGEKQVKHPARSSNRDITREVQRDLWCGNSINALQRATSPTPGSSPTTSTSSTISRVLVPSAPWVEAMVEHANTKRKSLRDRVKVKSKGGRDGRRSWEAEWGRLSPEQRRRVIKAVREEVVHAVSAYLGSGDVLFSVVCPELAGVDALLEERRGESGLSKLMRRCFEGKLQEPRSRAYAAVQAAIVEVEAEAAGYIKGATGTKGPIRAFLPTFRKLCSFSFCIGLLDAVDSGRADSSGGPTLRSFLGAVLRTAGSGVVLWVFFQGLKDMSENVGGGSRQQISSTADSGLALGALDAGGICEPRIGWGVSSLAGREDGREGGSPMQQTN